MLGYIPNDMTNINLVNGSANILPGIPRVTDPIHAVKMVLSDLGVEWVDVCRNIRKRENLEYRQIIQTLLSRNTMLSLAAIGVLVGYKNHATVINSKRIISQAEYVSMKTGKETELAKKYRMIESKFIILTNNKFRFYTAIQYKHNTNAESAILTGFK